MINDNFPTEVAKFLANDSEVYPAFYEVGTGTTTETRSDTALGTALIRTALVVSSEQSVVQFQVDWVSTETTIHSQSLRESGTFNLSSGGTLFDRSVNNAAVTPSNQNNVRVTKFTGIVKKPTSGRNLFVDDGVTEIFNYLGGTSDPPTHVAWSPDLVLEKVDVVGNWTDDSSAATTPTQNTANVREGTGSLNMGKDGTGSATFWYNNPLSSTIDCSKVTIFYVEFRIDNSTDLAKFTTNNCLTIKIGSDSSNYKSLSFDRADIFVGWQTITIVVSDMADTSSPNMSAVDFLEIRMVTTNSSDTITHGNLLLDYWRGYWPLSMTDTTLHDEQERLATTSTVRSGNQVVIKSVMTKSDGNTYNYRFTALFNDATTGDMFFGIETFDEIKDSNTQITTTFRITCGIYGDVT